MHRDLGTEISIGDMYRRHTWSGGSKGIGFGLSGRIEGTQRGGAWGGCTVPSQEFFLILKVKITHFVHF